MSVSSIFLILLVVVGFAFTSSSPGAPINPNDIIRESVNNAAGIDLIPKDAKFKLTDFHGVSSSDSFSYPDGRSGYASGTVYTGKLPGAFANGSIVNNKSDFILIIFSFAGLLLALRQ